MATIGNLQIRIGADVTAAINGLSRAQAAGQQVADSFAQQSAAANRLALNIGALSSTAAIGLQRIANEVNKVDIEGLDGESRAAAEGIKTTVLAAQQLTTTITAASGAFAILQQASGVAIAGIARLAPTLAPSIAALAGPIGLAVGALGALGAVMISNEAASANARAEADRLWESKNRQRIEALALIEVLKTNNLTLTKQEETVKKLNQVAGTNITLTKDQAENNKILAASYEQVQQALINKITIQAREEKLFEVAKQLQQQEDIISASIKKQNEEKEKSIQLADEEIKKRREQGRVVSQIEESIIRANALNTPETNLDRFNPNANVASNAQANFIEETRKKAADLRKEIQELAQGIVPLINSTDFSRAAPTVPIKLVPEFTQTQSLDIAPVTVDFIIAGVEQQAAEARRQFEAVGDILGANAAEAKVLREEFARLSVNPAALSVIGDIDQALVRLTERLSQITATPVRIDIQAVAFNAAVAEVQRFVGSYDQGLQQIAGRFSLLDNPQAQLQENIALTTRLLQQLGEAGKDSSNPFVQRLQGDLARFRAELEALNADPFKNLLEQLRSVQETFGTITSGLQSFLQLEQEGTRANFELRKQQAEEEEERQRAFIESTVVGQKNKEAAIQKLEEESSKKRRAIARQEAQAKKQAQLTEAIINSARAVVAALPNIPLSVTVGAIGAAQIAKIASTQIPALASGGIASGPTLALVGEYANANINPEVISPLRTLEGIIVNAISQQGGGFNTSVIRGDDLYLVNERQIQISKRVR